MMGRPCKLIHFANGTVHIDGIVQRSAGAGMLAERGEYLIVNAPPIGSRSSKPGHRAPACLLVAKRMGPWNHFDGCREADVQVVVSLDRTDRWQTRWLRPDATRTGPDDGAETPAVRLVRQPAEVTPPGVRVVSPLGNW